MHRTLITVSIAWFMLLPAPAFAQGELRVLTGGAMNEPVREVGEAFARSWGSKMVYVTDTTGALQKRLASGERADVIVLAAPGMDALQKDGRIIAASRVDVARALIGVGVRAGAASPDLSTVETFEAALLKAKSVAYVSPASGGTSGTYFHGLLQKMGIAEAMKPKIVFRNQGSEVAEAVAKGEAEIGITFTSELQPNKGVKVAGVLPAAIQLPTVYVGAVVAGSPNAETARAYLRALSAPAARGAVKKAGLEPVTAAR